MGKQEKTGVFTLFTGLTEAAMGTEWICITDGEIGGKAGRIAVTGDLGIPYWKDTGEDFNYQSEDRYLPFVCKR